MKKLVLLIIAVFTMFTCNCVDMRNVSFERDVLSVRSRTPPIDQTNVTRLRTPPPVDPEMSVRSHTPPHGVGLGVSVASFIVNTLLLKIDNKLEEMDRYIMERREEQDRENRRMIPAIIQR